MSAATPICFDPDRFAPIVRRIDIGLRCLVVIAKHLRLRYVQLMPNELEAGVNPRSKHDFIMVPARHVTAIR
jgi:hypothetical protein